MAVKKFKPVTAGTRHKIGGTFDEITTSVPEKSLLSVKKSSGGRNNTGKMTVRYIGGGHKQMYRNVDFKRAKDGVAATVKTIEYDPNRTARIALIVYADGQKSYIIAPNGLQVGQTVCSGAGVAPEVGNTLFLSEIPLGTIIHNIELYPGAISASGAIALAVGIAIQNFPEGAIISAPLAASGTPKGKAFACGTLSGAAEPVGAILTILVTSLVTPVLPYILAFAAGAMIYVVIEELIPESRSDEHSNVGTVGAALGFALMMLLDVALG